MSQIKALEEEVATLTAEIQSLEDEIIQLKKQVDKERFDLQDKYQREVQGMQDYMRMQQISSYGQYDYGSLTGALSQGRKKRTP